MMGVFFAFRPKASKQPNIIVVVTDDHRWDALGAMGNIIIQTPNLDQLAHKGLLFKNAYVTTAICMVSRASILNGQYLSRHKINEFTTDFSKEAVAQTYSLLLKKAGYKIGFINKYGVGQKNTPKEYFDFWTCIPKLQPTTKCRTKPVILFITPTKPIVIFRRSWISLANNQRLFVYPLVLKLRTSKTVIHRALLCRKNLKICTKT